MVVKKTESLKNTTLTSILSSGGIAIIPCDTIYGIVGISPETEDRIRQIKGRNVTKPFIRLIASSSMLSQFSEREIDPHIIDMWPGPLTLVVPSKEGGTIGLRVPADDYLQTLLQAVKHPLISTSVNRSDENALNNIGEIIRHFEHEVDIIVDDGDLQNTRPSTVLDVTRKPYRILRNGACNIPSYMLT